VIKSIKQSVFYILDHIKMSFNFNFKSNAKIEAIIQSELTNREITDIDMIAFGNIIMNIAKFLSKKVNDELPLCQDSCRMN